MFVDLCCQFLNKKIICNNIKNKNTNNSFKEIATIRWEIIAEIINIKNYNQVIKKKNKNTKYYYFAWNVIYGFTELESQQEITTGLHYEIDNCHFNYYEALNKRMGIKSIIVIESGDFHHRGGLLSVIDKIPEISGSNYGIYPFVAAFDSIIKYNKQRSDTEIENRNYRPSENILDSAARVLLEGAKDQDFAIICKAKEHNFYSTDKTKMYAFKNEGEFFKYNLVHYLKNTSPNTSKKKQQIHHCQRIKFNDIIIVDGIQLNITSDLKPYFYFHEHSRPKIYHNFSKKWQTFFKFGNYHGDAEKIKDMEVLWGLGGFKECKDEWAYRNIMPRRFTSISKAVLHSKKSGKHSNLVINCQRIINSKVLEPEIRIFCEKCKEQTDDINHCSHYQKNKKVWFQGVIILTWKEIETGDPITLTCILSGKMMKSMLYYCIQVKPFIKDFDWKKFETYGKYFDDILENGKRLEKREVAYTWVGIKNCLDVIQHDSTQQFVFRVKPIDTRENKPELVILFHALETIPTEDRYEQIMEPPLKKRKGNNGVILTNDHNCSSTDDIME